MILLNRQGAKYARANPQVIAFLGALGALAVK